MTRFARETLSAFVVATVMGAIVSPALARPGDEADAIAATQVAEEEAETEAAKALVNARAAFDDRDYASALDQLLPLADGGDADAQTLIGYMYRTGLLGMPDQD